MNGQYLMNRQLSITYAFKKDTRGERHGTPAERLLAAQVPPFVGLLHAGRSRREARACTCLHVSRPDCASPPHAPCRVGRRLTAIALPPLLPKQKRAKEKKSSRPHTMFATGPQQARLGEGASGGPSGSDELLCMHACCVHLHGATALPEASPAAAAADQHPFSTTGLQP